MRRFALLSLLGLLALPGQAVAQGNSPIPRTHIPSTVLLELRALESQFDLALAGDCASDRCFSKGCVYRDHAVVDMPRGSSLPGIAQAEGPGSVPAQEYLTQARCEFTHEKAVATKDVQALVRRLEQRLSKGWLRVSVARQILEPVSEELRENPPPQAPALAAPLALSPPAPPPGFEEGQALRELWLSLLPHFPWMIALVLVTLATLLIIWGLRRVGKDTLEEKALAAQLTAGQPGVAAQPQAEGTAAAAVGAEPAAEADFARDQRQLWAQRLGEADLDGEEGAVVELLRQWLRAGEFELLAKAIFVFGDRLSLAFGSEGELAVRKVELAEYLRTAEEKQLLSDADFFRKLNQHSLSASLLAQADAELYRSLSEEFGPSGVAGLIEALPARPGALLFALVPQGGQHEVARIMAPELRLQVVSELLRSNRICREETGYLLEVLSAGRKGLPLPLSPPSTGLADRGRELDAALALSVLLAQVEASDRQALFATALQRASGVFPRWYENILYGDMLLKLPEELRADLLLEVDVKGLAGWYSVQHPGWQEGFLARMAPSMQKAVRASMGFGSREDQLRQARRGHQELVAAVKKQVAQGKLSFAEIVS